MAKQKLGKINTIRQGDSIKLMQKLPDGCVDLAFADPPFNIGYKYDVYDDRQSADDYLDWSQQWIEQVHRILKSDGAFWLAIGDDFAAELKILSQKLGFHSRNWVIWYYTFGVHCKNKFTRSHTHLFYFVKDKQNFTFNRDAIALPSARQLVYNDARANPKGRVPDDTWILRPQECADGFTPDESTWYFPRVAGTFKEREGFHGCQMPEQLLARIIRACSNHAELVLDPFSGSATTAAVAKKLGRNFLSFELSKEYVEHGKKRILDIQEGDPIDGAEDPLISAPSSLTEPFELEPASTKNRTFAQRNSILKTSRKDYQSLIEAISETHNGYSVDRLILDPELNQTFLDVCYRKGIPGTASELNRAAFRIRKTGRLRAAGIVTQKRTSFTWEIYDKFIDASEIAWKRILDDQENSCESLDEIFCDPIIAKKFDGIATEYAPGFSSLEYRWAALTVRKASKMARSRADRLAELGKVFKKEKAFELQDLNKQHPESGIYLVIGNHEGKKKPLYLYAGGSMNLSRRFDLRFQNREAEKAWKENWESLKVKYLPLESSPTQLLAYQSRAITDLETSLNTLNFAAS